METAVARSLVVNLVLLLCSSSVSLGQMPTGVITGFVRDSTGAPVVSADVLARDLQSGFTYGSISDEFGRYWFNALPPGEYEISASRIGLAPSTWPSVTLLVGRTITVDFTLRVSPVRVEPIEVQAVRPLLDFTQPDVAFNLTREQIDRLPNESRRFIDLALLGPGSVASSETADPVATTSVGALNSYNLGVWLDGGNMIGAELNDYLGAAPLLAVQEFEVLTTSYSVEFGQAASGIINAVTRRGTNTLQAEGFFLGRNRDLNALGVFESEKPDYNRRHWGVAVGGPLRRDRTHYFFSFEREVEDFFSTVETGGAFPELEGTFRTPWESNVLFGRLDDRLSDGHEVMVRYAGNLTKGRASVGTCEEIFGQPAAENWGVDLDNSVHSLLAMHRWKVSAAAVNEARVHFLRQSLQRTPVGEGPSMIYPTMCAGQNFAEWDIRNTRLELKDNLTLTTSGTTGSHRIKLGGLAAWVQSVDESRWWMNGGFFFSEDSASLPGVYRAAYDPGLQLDEDNVQLALYAEDAWSPARNVTVTLGLRYDVEVNGTNQGFRSPMADSLPFVSGDKRSTDLNNVAPRIGFAVDPRNDGRTVVRGGFGVFYNQHLLLFPGIESTGTRWAVVPDPGVTDPDSIAVNPDTIPPSFSVLGDELSTPYTLQLSLGLEQVILGNVVISLDGILVDGRNIPIKRKLSEWGVQQILNRGEARTSMLMVRARKEFVDGRFDLQYTYADREATNDVWLDFTPQVDWENESFSGEMGPASWDQLHRFVGLVDARLPFDFVVGLALLYASARPYNAVTGTDDNGDGIRFNDRRPGEGRNARRSTDFSRIDLGVTKWVTLGRTQLGVALNIYNLFNRTNYDAKSVVGLLGSPVFGQALAAHPKRQVEIGLRFRF